MRISDPIKISYNNLRASKFRSFLTVLGIIIGVGSVILVMAIGSSAQQLVLDQVEGVGSNLIGILPGASDEKGPPASVFGVVVTTLKYKDLQAIGNQKNVPSVVDVAGYVTGAATVKSATENVSASFQGTTASYISVENTKVGKGRFFTKDEETNMARVVVLGFNRASDLFPNDDPLGKIISIKDTNLTVIGVLEKRGSVAFSSPDDMIFVPLFTAQKLILGIDYLNFIRAKVGNVQDMDMAVVDIKQTIRDNHNIKKPEDDDFSVRNSAQALELLTNITSVLKYFLVSIASISLLVGGVGIMNIMLIAVNQRIREVGLRKAVGATNKNVIFQFLIESIFITLIGGILGIIMGILFAFLASLIINGLGYDWKFIIMPSSIGIAFAVSFLIGLVFGLYPARKAAKISPMEALRYE
jgi:putative ABC transport system permease protein